VRGIGKTNDLKLDEIKIGYGIKSDSKDICTTEVDAGMS